MHRFFPCIVFIMHSVMSLNFMTSFAWAETVTRPHNVSDTPNKSVGLPQFNPEFYSSQIVWVILCFALLYFLMAKFALPQVADTIEKRQNIISNDLDRAEELRQETENIKIAYDKALIQADQHAATFMANTMDEINADSAAKIQTATNEVNQSIDEALGRLEGEKHLALKEVDSIAKDIAADLSASLLSLAFPTKRKKKA